MGNGRARTQTTAHMASPRLQNEGLATKPSCPAQHIVFNNKSILYGMSFCDNTAKILVLTLQALKGNSTYLLFGDIILYDEALSH